LRIYSRLKYAPRRLSAEDYFILLATAVLNGITAMCCWGCIDLQWGYRTYDFTFHSITTTGSIIFAHQLLSSVDTFLIRMALVLFIRRLYLRSGSHFVYVCNFILGLMVALSVAIVLATVFQCGTTGVRGNWDLVYRVQIKCSPTKVNWVQSGVGMAADTIVLALPLRVSMQMMMRTFAERLRICALLGFGIIAWSASIARLVYIGQFNKNGNISDVINAILATQFECAIAICCSCAPAIKSLMSSVSPKEEESPFGTPSKASPAVTIGTVGADGASGLRSGSGTVRSERASKS